MTREIILKVQRHPTRERAYREETESACDRCMFTETRAIDETKLVSYDIFIAIIGGGVDEQ